MAKVLITGITGFIGSNLAKRLITLGYEVYGVTRHCASRSLKPIDDILDDVVLLTADIDDSMAISQVLKSANPDYLFHLAALSPVRLSFEKPFEYERFDYYGTMCIVHALMQMPNYEKKRLLLASTAEVYGTHENSEIPLKETASLNPTSPYAVSKAAADMYVRMAAEVYGVDGVVLRPVNSYGRKYETNFMVEYTITSMLKGNKIYVGAPDSIREYLYVDDHINSYIKAMENGKKGQAYNISTGKGITNRELVNMLAQKLGADEKQIVYGSYPPGYPFRPNVSDQPYIILDSSKAKEGLNWSAKVDLSEGLEKTISYWQSKLA